MKPILVVDDDPQMRDAMKEAINRLGFKAILAENGLDALTKLSTTPVGLVVTDMMMPRMDGLAFLKEVRKRIGQLPVLVITGFGTVENAVEAMKEGATDYLMKPFSFDKLTKKINSIMDAQNTDREIVFVNQKMMRIMQIAKDIASSDTTVLIYGESGTGKELIARFIHKTSPRKEKPFVAVNCAAIPDNLMESELFGHEKGAFTGASEKKLGKFELANEGTILLDEIGEMSMSLQAKLLRVLQEKEIDRVGGKHTVAVDSRVIATTNRDLFKESSEGRFREDLYYRLSVFPIHIPPLRERPDDIKPLCDYFVKKYSSILGKTISGFSKEAIEYLENKQWRGNIRELENVVHRTVLLCKGDSINVGDFMQDDPVSSNTESNQRGIKKMEKELILKTLKDVGNNKTKAAKLLGVSVRTIRNKLNEYGNDFPD